MPSSTHAPSSGTRPSSTNTSASRILVLSRWNTAWRLSSGVVGRPVALDALREEDIEANDLEPVREFEVGASLSLREQWSCEVDQLVSTSSENQTDHRASTPAHGGQPVPAIQGSSGPSAVPPPAAPGQRARSTLRRRRGRPRPSERLPGPQGWGSDRDRSSSSRPEPCRRLRSRVPSRPEGRLHSPSPVWPLL